MTNPFIAALRVSDAGPDERYWLTRELRRYEVAARRFREAGIVAFADLFAGYAEQARLEIEALAKVEQRLADLDAKSPSSLGDELSGEIANTYPEAAE